MSYWFCTPSFICVLLGTACFPLSYYEVCRKVIESELNAQDNWILVSDNWRGKEVFGSECGFKKRATVNPIPVLDFDQQAYLRDSTLDLVNYYSLDTTQFLGILSKAGKSTRMVHLRASGEAVPARQQTYLTTTSDLDVRKIYAEYKQNQRCFFWDISRKGLCYLEGKVLWSWDFEAQMFYKTRVPVKK